jgi:hypothetical protein
MLELAVLLRSMQLFSHSAHHLCAHSVFFPDHAFFSETYQAMDDAYDSIIERIIGLYGEDSVDLNRIISEVALKLHDAPSVGTKENKIFYEYQLKLEQELCAKVEEICKNPKASQGVIQTVATLGEQSEIRQYKIKRRLL